MYDNFLNFYNRNRGILFSDELRPAKSITRNIITGVSPFIRYYRETNRISFMEEEIAQEILGLTGPSSTSKDNIRNLMEIKFLAYRDRLGGKEYYFTRNFIDFVNSNSSLTEYIFNQLTQIRSVWDITMFYNCILCTLREGILYGSIINYPDSYDKFAAIVEDGNERTSMCRKVYDLYSFKGRNRPFGTYTPNAIYRFISTCQSIGIVEDDGFDNHGLKKYKISDKGFRLLNILDNQLR